MPATIFDKVSKIIFFISDILDESAPERLFADAVTKLSVLE